MTATACDLHPKKATPVTGATNSHYMVGMKSAPSVKPMTLKVRLSGSLEEFVAFNIGQRGQYDNASEYVRDLIRRDKERVEAGAFERLRAELHRAFATPDADYAATTASDVINRNRERRASK